jgi:hypothetical protein
MNYIFGRAFVFYKKSNTEKKFHYFILITFKFITNLK